MTHHTKAAWLAVAVLAAQPMFAEDWTHFRGSSASTGVADKCLPPVKWSDKENVAFKVDLPGRGLSGPLVIGDKVYLTASGGGKQDEILYVLCHDAKTGAKLWQRSNYCSGRISCHPKMCMATPTPASDGKRIVAFYSCNDCLCYDLEGNLLWARGLTSDYKNASNSVGMSSSPIIVDDVVILQVENDDDSFAVGLDMNTGLNRWRIARPKASTWSTPVMLPGRNGGAPVVLLHSKDKLTAHNPKTGETVWSIDQGVNPIVSSTISADRILVPFAKEGLALVDIAADGPKVLWKEKKLSSGTPTPVAFQGRVYALTGPILSCADLETGNVLWKTRLSGAFSSSPIVAGGRIYAINEDGAVFVIVPSDKQGEIVATNKLGETVLCTPAFADNAMFVRSDKHLWKIAEKK